MQPVKASTGVLALPMPMSCFENICPDPSFCNSTRIFLLKVSILNFFFLRIEDFKQALISSTDVERGITGLKFDPNVHDFLTVANADRLLCENHIIHL